MLTRYGDISPRTAAFAVKELLERGQQLMVLERFGQVDPQGKNKTLTRKYRRYNPLPLATSPLVEGVTPAGHRLTYTDITCTLQQYGDLVQITDVIADTHEDPVLQEAMQLCAEQAAETVEVIRYNHLRGGTNVVYAGGAVSRAAVVDPPARGDLRLIVRGFRRAKARPISRIIAPTPNVATQPVAEAYFAIGHTDLDSDIRNMSGFVPAENYSNVNERLPGEIGKVENIRFILTPLFEPWLMAGGNTSTMLTGGGPGEGPADVYPILVIARDAYALVPLQGANAITIAVSNPGKPAPGDELGQRGFVSWKTYQTAVILQDLWLCRYEVACTAIPS